MEITRDPIDVTAPWDTYRTFVPGNLVQIILTAAEYDLVKPEIEAMVAKIRAAQR